MPDSSVSQNGARQRLADLDAERTSIVADLNAAKARKTVKCNHCGKRTPIRLLTYIQTHFYVSPYGCTGGDYWSEGEGRFACPKCGYENRLIYRPEVVKLKRFFAEVVERHSDPEKHARKWCN